MSDDIEMADIKVAKADWDSTPASIQALVLVLNERLTQLEEKLNQNSQNSSQPPSSDGFGKGEKSKGQPQQQRQVSETQAPRQVRKLTPIEACAVVEAVLPAVCCQCGTALSGYDPPPHRHQVMALPPSVPTVNEYRLHPLSCQQCDQLTQAPLPLGGSPSGDGER